MRNTFTAQWAGKCFKCQGSIYKGDRAFFVGPTRDEIYGEICCGDYTDAELATAVLPLLKALEDQELEDAMTVPVSHVLPRGKSIASMCRKCFQIPSNNGVCGCD
jgi:hypothetical protein